MEKQVTRDKNKYNTFRKKYMNENKKLIKTHTTDIKRC